MEKNNSLPVWLLDSRTVDEPEFCRYFVKKHPLMCIHGRFYDYDGPVDEDALGNEIYKMLLPGVRSGIARKTAQILETLRHYCYSQPPVPDENFVYLQNGKLDLHGNFYPGREFCLNRLNIVYNPSIREGVYYPRKIFNFSFGNAHAAGR